MILDNHIFEDLFEDVHISIPTSRIQANDFTVSMYFQSKVYCLVIRQMACLNCNFTNIYAINKEFL